MTTDSPPPAELLTFKPEDWPGTPDEKTWLPAYHRWKTARRTWDTDTPGSLGRVVDRMRHERRTRNEWMQRHPPTTRTIEEKTMISIEPAASNNRLTPP